jgi:hypothetical protein
MAFFEQALAEMRSEKAGAAGNNRSFHKTKNLERMKDELWYMKK